MNRESLSKKSSSSRIYKVNVVNKHDEITNAHVAKYDVFPHAKGHGSLNDSATAYCLNEPQFFDMISRLS